MLLVTIFAVPILIVAIILAALKIKSKRLKIIGIAVPSIIAAVLLAFAVSDIFILIDVLLLGDTDPGSQFVAPVEGITNNQDGTFTYDDGEVSLTFEQISSDEKDNAISEAPSVLNGESCGNEWTVVSDDEGVPKTVYVTSGDTTVSAKVNNTPKDSGKEYAASIAAALVTDKKPYSENKTESKYRTDSSSFYIEEANCLLYYPAQLSSFSKKGDSYIFKDKKSSASLKVTLSPNNYTSMAEVEGFIKNTENNLVLAYGPNWFTSEIRKNEKVSFGYSGFGSKYIVEAELSYPENISGIYDDLRGLVKCCFVGDGIWKSKASSEGYSKDCSTTYSDKFSREIAAYYSKEYGVILLYPELFSQVEKQDGGVFFTDPVTEATISFWADSEYLSLADWPERYGLNDSYIDGERRVKASHTDGGTYAVMYLTDNKNVCAFLEYPMEYAWVYEEFEDEFTIVASGSEIRNIEMQTVFIEAYGALITMPLQFSETSFYDGVIRYEDALNGMELTVSFDYLTSEKERKNLFACFDVVADDDNIFVGDSYVRWLSNQGFFYGARGNDMKVLMQIDSPNAERAYESTLSMFSVEFVTEESKEETKAQIIAKEAAGIKPMSDPPEETVKPNKRLIYESDEDYAYAITDGAAWCKIEDDYIQYSIETMGEEPEGMYYFQGWEDTVVNILKILKYNNYDTDYYCAQFMDSDDYTEESMIYKLITETNFKMYFYYRCTPRQDSDLGEGVPSVLEAICEILEIEKPEYVRDRGDITPDNNRTIDVSELEGVWYYNEGAEDEIDYTDFDETDFEIIWSDIFIEIDGNGNWGFFQRSAGDTEAEELDHGVFSADESEANAFYANSTWYDGQQYRVVYGEDGVLYWREIAFYRNRENNQNTNLNPLPGQKDISEFEGNWYDASAGTVIKIDGDGNWSLSEFTDGSKSVESDRGTFAYSEEDSKTYYAYSAQNDGVRYKMVEYDEGVILWEDGIYYLNDSISRDNEYYSWNEERYQRCVAEFAGIWYYDKSDYYASEDDEWYNIFIVIDSDGNWTTYQNVSGDSEATEIDHGIFTYSEEFGSTYYANSTKYDGVRYTMFEFESESYVTWEGRGFERVSAVNSGAD